MTKTSNGFALSYILLLVSTSIFSHQSVAFGSPVQEQRFHRADPLRHFKFYRGGYDLKNKHYWASAAFTGVHGYAIGGVWMLCGLVFGSYIVLTRSSSSAAVAQNSSSLYIIVFILVLLLSFLAIVATGLVIAANQSSLQRTKKLEETVLGAGGEARKTIRKVTDAMDEMQKLLLPYDPQTCYLLNSTSYQLGKESRLIRNFGRKYEHSISKAIQISYAANLAVVSVNLGCLTAALVLLFFHWQPGFVIIIPLCWFIATLCWVLTGFDFFFQTFARDTCSALANYEQNPQNNSLSSVLPCSSSINSEKVLMDIGYTVHNSIKELNSKITQFSGLVRLEEEQDDSSFGVKEICDPFSAAPNFSYAPENCSKDSIPIGALPGVLSRFTCYRDSNETNCDSNGRFIPEASYLMVRAYSSALQDLINIFPDLQDLIQCSFVKETFSDVVLHQCKPFTAAARRLWLSVLCLSIITMVLVLLWAVSFSGCWIIPILLFQLVRRLLAKL